MIISKELNEWLEKHQTLDTDDTIYSKRFGRKIFDKLYEEVEVGDTKKYDNILEVFGLSGYTKVVHLWLLLNRDKWEVEEDELFYICIPEPKSSVFNYTSLSKVNGIQYFDRLPDDKDYKWTQEEIDKHEVAKHLEYFKKKVEE
ncbi:hypothetical protein HR11_09980 [Porphyromonas macacae]|nr:hypothetical protein HR11_09980 [Porphyromonas macacae]PWL82978.1 MAG: hypothetical protein DBY24_02555 [Prevotellaceae bacterium]TKU04643.1 hypothetical protein FDW96_12460 [Citrobacter sp. TBCS-15]TKV31205.1 hypothetical protein FDX20_21385 [Citrobacter sp. TBCS-11]